MSGYIGATGLTDDGERFDELQENIDANASYINNLVGIPDPFHTAIFGINVLNPGLFGLVERAEVKIKLLETAEEGLGTDLTGLTTQVEGIQTEVTGIQTEILGIQGEITGIDSSISAIQFVQIPALGVLIGTADGIAVDARNKANRALDIWDYSGDNTYNKKAGNVGIGTTFGSVLNNKLEVAGNVNIPLSSNYKINNEPLNYSHLAGTPPVSSKWTNATDTTTNIYYNTGNVGIGITTAINNKLEVNGNLNISAGSKYKINNVNLAFSDLGGTLSYNSLTNQLTGGTNIQILNGVINNTYTYTLPTATTNAIGGVRPDGSTILINNGVISSTGGTAQVNSDWTQTNTSLKSFIQNKPTAGTNISLANNTITNIITGSPTQNIITLNDNYLIVKDKPDSQIVTNVDVPLTSGNEPTYTPQAFTTERMYPPVRNFTAATTIVSGQTYGNGTYVVSFSPTTGGSLEPWTCFNTGITSGGAWAENRYTAGNYNSTSFIVSGYLGDWVKIQLPVAIKLTRFEFLMRNEGYQVLRDRAPKDFKIYGSNDNITWVELVNKTDAVYNASYRYEQTTPEITSTYTYYGLVVNKLFSTGTILNFDEWYIYGQETIVAIAEGNPITHKTLNFAYTPNYPFIQADNTNLKAWYKFDGNYNDSSPSGYNLTNSGTVIVNGLIVQSVSADASDFLETSGINLNGKTYSISFWAKFNTIPASDVFFWTQSSANAVGSTVVLQYQQGNNVLRFSHYGSGNDMDTTGYNISSMVGTSWHHYVVTYNNTNRGAEIWLDGVKLNTNISTLTNAFTGGGNFTIGKWVTNPNIFNGLMEDFRYYDKILTSTEISQLYNIPTTNQYTLSVQSGTSIQVNNGTAQYLSGNYTISVGATQSSVLGLSGQTNPYPLTNGSTIAIRYSMLQRITTTINIKKDGLIKYVPASGTNPTTGTWNIIDIDTQLLTQFAGNLPISRIDGNVSGKLPLSLTDGNLPAIRLDNIDMSKVATGNLAWSRISSQPALSSLSGNLDWSRIDSKPALSSLSGSLLWNRIDQGSFYMPVDRWIQDTNAYDRFYLAGNSTTFIRGFSATIVEFRDGNNNTRSIFNSNGQIACHFQTVSPTNTDHLGVGANTGDGGFGYYYIHVLYNTFTGFHRCYYEDDEIFNNDMSNEEIDIFKNNYKGRIVISTGKIKTDISRTIPNEETEDDGNRPSNYEEIKNESANVEWYSTIDKDGIMIEDAIPIVQLSKVRKDKRVYGVLGSADRKTNNKNRLIVNSVGEGAICVCNTNGNIENGDYIQSSELLGFGEKQDDDILHNYSVAKAVMNCTFELDSPYYQCYELEGGVRVAFIACTYHSG